MSRKDKPISRTMHKINKYCCIRCWRDKNIVEMELSMSAMNAFSRNTTTLECPVCQVILPRCTTYWDEDDEEWKPSDNLWIPFYTEDTRRVAFEQLHLIKEGNMPWDEQSYMAPYNPRDPIVIKYIKEVSKNG